MQTRRLLEAASHANLGIANNYVMQPRRRPNVPSLEDAAVQCLATDGIQRESKPSLAVAMQGPRSRLDSWKQIASHFSRDVRTVQRWEKYEGLPVRRHLHDKTGSVYAFAHEVNAWWESRTVRSAETRSVRRAPFGPESSKISRRESQQNSLAPIVRGTVAQETKDEAVTVLMPPLPRLSGPSRKGLVNGPQAAWPVFSQETEKESELLKDLNRAMDVQATMLPHRGLALLAWETYYDYAPAAGVGGDYCDLVSADTGDLFFFFGDGVGKGIAGSMIASQLHALFRTLLFVRMPLDQMFEHANRLFCDSMATDYYATVVCGRASSDGAVEVINAGHVAPLVLRAGRAMPLPATGVPLGLFPTSTYGVTKIQLEPGETLFFYTDGITEARNRLGAEYSPERLARFVARRSHLSAEGLVRTCVKEIKSFADDSGLADDQTLLALRRV